MLKTLALALVLLVGCTCSGIQKIRPSLDQTQEYESVGIRVAVESSVRILAYCGPSKRLDSVGSGVAVSPKEVISARHVAVACQGSPTPDWVIYEALLDNGDTYELATDRMANEDTDVVRFTVVGMRTLPRWTELATYQPRVGQRVTIYAGAGVATEDRKEAGFWSFMLKFGVVSHTYKDVVVISTHGVPGNSGGAIFDDDGRVIGIISSGVWHFAHENFVDALRPTYWPELWPESIQDLLP